MVDDYLESAVRRLLAEDERISELALRVACHADRITISGEVETPQRREQIMRVLAEAFPDSVLCDDIGIARANEPMDIEEISH